MNICELTNFIQAADACHHVPLIKGVHGLGKSEVVAAYARNNSMHYEPLILSLFDTGDMIGIPQTVELSGMAATTWAAPTWYTNIVNAAWPAELSYERLQFEDTDFQQSVVDTLQGSTITREDLNNQFCEFYNLPNDKLQLLRQDKVHFLDGKRSLLFLDEFNRAPRDILDASLQLILDHRLHSHILPLVKGRETLIVAAINPADGNYGVQEFDPALLDRFVECDIEPDFTAWYEYNKKTKGNKVVSDFLSENRTKLHFTPKDGTKGASPRSWSRLGKYISLVQETKEPISLDYIKGTVGSALAAQFISYYNSYDSSLSYKELNALIKKKIKANPQKDLPELAELIAETVNGIDAIKRSEFADSFKDTYSDKEEVKDALPWMVYLHALPLESLSAVLKSIQTDDVDSFAKLVLFDKETTNKALLRKVTSKLKRTQE